jgi:hypothetical protein
MLRCNMRRWNGAQIMPDKIEPIMSPDFARAMNSPADLVNAVMQTNLRAAQALLRAESPAAVLALQQRFVREYTTVLMRGTLSIVGAIEAAQQPTLSYDA